MQFLLNSQAHRLSTTINFTKRKFVANLSGFCYQANLSSPMDKPTELSGVQSALLINTHKTTKHTLNMHHIRGKVNLWMVYLWDSNIRERRGVGREVGWAPSPPPLGPNCSYFDHSKAQKSDIWPPESTKMPPRKTTWRWLYSQVKFVVISI